MQLRVAPTKAIDRPLERALEGGGDRPFRQQVAEWRLRPLGGQKMKRAGQGRAGITLTRARSALYPGGMQA